jgi:protein SCO1/2
MLGTAVLSLAAAQASGPDGQTVELPFSHETALAASQAAIGRTLHDTIFRDTRGQPFRLQQLAGKPIVVSLIYTSCHHVCPLITRNLEKTVAVARDAFGEDTFAVVTIGFDWQIDTPEQMRVYASSRGIDQRNWHFLSGDAAAIAAITDDLGFRHTASAKGYDHLSQTTIIDHNGRVYRQVYGQDFDAPALVEPLKELVFDTPVEAGIIEHWVDTFRFFCTVYDPNSGRYLFDYSIFMTIIVGVLCLGAILAFIVYEWRRAV